MITATAISPQSDQESDQESAMFELKSEESKELRLFNAARDANKNIIIETLNGGFDINSAIYAPTSDPRGRTSASPHTNILNLLMVNKHYNLALELIDSYSADVNIRDGYGNTPLAILSKSISVAIHEGEIPPEEMSRRQNINYYISQLIQRRAIVREQDLNFNVHSFFEGTENETTETDYSCEYTKKILQEAFDDQPFLLSNEFYPTADNFILQNALFLAKMSNFAYESNDDNILAKGLENLSYVIQSQDRKFKAFVIGCQDMIIVCFRGTENLENWRKNLNVNLKCKEGRDNSKIHTGFDDALSKVWEQVCQHIEGLKNTLSRDNPHVWFTGHSLGGAMAILAADRYTDSHMDQQQLCHIYTFGAPLVGNENFSREFNAKFNGKAYMIINELDPVPCAVPVSLGYASVGNWRLMDSNYFLYNDESYFKDQIGYTYDKLGLQQADERERWIASVYESSKEIKPLVYSRDKGFYIERNNLVATGLNVDHHYMATAYVYRIEKILEKLNSGELIVNNAAMSYKIQEAMEKRDTSYLVQFKEYGRNSYQLVKNNPLKSYTAAAAVLIGGSFYAYKNCKNPVSAMPDVLVPKDRNVPTLLYWFTRIAGADTFCVGLYKMHNRPR